MSCVQALDSLIINSPHDEYITRHFSGTKNRRISALNSETDTKVKQVHLL